MINAGQILETDVLKPGTGYWANARDTERLYIDYSTKGGKLRIHGVSWYEETLKKLVGGVAEMGIEPIYCLVPKTHYEDVISAEDLPTEFFNHQLLEVNPEDENSVYQFVREWGFPFAEGNRVSGENLTNAAFNYLKPKSLRNWIDDFDSMPMGLQVISYREASSVLRLLRKLVIASQEVVKDACGLPGCSEEEMDFFDENVSVLDDWSSNPHVVTQRFSAFGNRGFYPATLTNAICNQVLEAMADPAPWRICACEGCGLVFKRKQGGKKPGHTGRSDSVFCCNRCKERQSKRNTRKKRKRGADHGVSPTPPIFGRSE